MQTVIVIPAYNEEKTVGEVVRQAQEVFPHPSFCVKGASASGGGHPLPQGEGRVRVIVVDDGSTDQTAQVARKAGAQVLRHPLNRGLGAALSTGITVALQLITHHSIIVTLDADGQHSPAEIPLMIEPIVKGEADVVIGSRLKSKIKNQKSKIPLMRVIANFFGNFFTWLLFGIWVSDSQSGFRAFSVSAAKQLRLRTSTMEVSSEIIREVARLKLRLVEVPVTVKYTQYSLAKGQGFFRGLVTLWKLILLKFFR